MNKLFKRLSYLLILIYVGSTSCASPKKRINGNANEVILKEEQKTSDSAKICSQLNNYRDIEFLNISKKEAMDKIIIAQEIIKIIDDKYPYITGTKIPLFLLTGSVPYNFSENIINSKSSMYQLPYVSVKIELFWGIDKCNKFLQKKELISIRPEKFTIYNKDFSNGYFIFSDVRENEKNGNFIFEYKISEFETVINSKFLNFQINNPSFKILEENLEWIKSTDVTFGN